MVTSETLCGLGSCSYWNRLELDYAVIFDGWFIGDSW